nr:hypothetical protein [uncultured Flavobacterium sp.]
MIKKKSGNGKPDPKLRGGTTKQSEGHAQKISIIIKQKKGAGTKSYTFCLLDFRLLDYIISNNSELLL